MLEFFATNKDAFLAIGVVASSCVSLLIAFLSINSSRRSSTNALREKWIDALRTEVAELVSIRAFVHSNLANATTLADAYRDAHRLSNSIQIRMDSRFKEHRDLANKTDDFVRMLRRESISPEELDAIERDLRVLCTDVTNLEWQRIQKG